MRRRLLIAALLPALLAPAPAAQAQEPTPQVQPKYRGWVGGFGERRHRRVQGQYHALRFRVNPAGRLRYRVCLSGGAADVRRCFRRRTGPRGRSEINVSLFVNDRGGPGRWRAVWRVRGDRVASWRFRLVPE
ncbi:MAG: hypothetical protein ACRDPC_01050 [Solirubrobacteraceae bacterium]